MAESSVEDERLSTVRRFYSLVAAGDLGGAERLLGDDLVIRVPESLPYGGDYHGPAGFREDMARIMELIDPGVVQVNYLESSDPVVLKIVGRFTSKATGESLDMDIVELFTVKDGRIVELDVYYKDPTAINALVAA